MLVALVYIYIPAVFVVFNRRWYGNNVKHVPIDSPHSVPSHTFLQVASVVVLCQQKKRSLYCFHGNSELYILLGIPLEQDPDRVFHEHLTQLMLQTPTFSLLFTKINY